MSEMSHVVMCRLLLTGFVLVMLVGCGAPERAPAPENEGPPPTLAAPPENVILELVDVDLRFGRPLQFAPGRGRSLSVTVPVQHGGPAPVSIEYRFEFLDASGEPLTSPLTEWREMYLPPGVRMFLEPLQSDPDAVDWRLRIRRAR